MFAIATVLALGSPAVMRASDGEAPPARESQRSLHPAQPLTMGPGPTGIALAAFLVAVAARRSRQRRHVADA